MQKEKKKTFGVYLFGHLLSKCNNPLRRVEVNPSAAYSKDEQIQSKQPWLDEKHDVTMTMKTNSSTVVFFSSLFYSEAGFYTLCGIFAILIMQINTSPPQNGCFLRSQQTSERGLDCSHAAQDFSALCLRLV